MLWLQRLWLRYEDIGKNKQNYTLQQLLDLEVVNLKNRIN